MSRLRWSKLSRPNEHGWVRTSARLAGAKLHVEQRTNGERPTADDWSAEIVHRGGGFTTMVGRASLRDARQWCEHVAEGYAPPERKQSRRAEYEAYRERLLAQPSIAVLAARTEEDFALHLHGRLLGLARGYPLPMGSALPELKAELQKLANEISYWTACFGGR